MTLKTDVLWQRMDAGGFANVHTEHAHSLFAARLRDPRPSFSSSPSDGSASAPASGSLVVSLASVPLTTSFLLPARLLIVGEVDDLAAETTALDGRPDGASTSVAEHIGARSAVAAFCSTLAAARVAMIRSLGLARRLGA